MAHLPLETKRTVGCCCAVFTRDRCTAIVSTRFGKSLCFANLFNRLRYIKEDDLHKSIVIVSGVVAVLHHYQVFVTFVQQL